MVVAIWAPIMFSVIGYFKGKPAFNSWFKREALREETHFQRKCSYIMHYITISLRSMHIAMEGSSQENSFILFLPSFPYTICVFHYRFKVISFDQSWSWSLVCRGKPEIRSLVEVVWVWVSVTSCFFPFSDRQLSCYLKHCCYIATVFFLSYSVIHWIILLLHSAILIPSKSKYWEQCEKMKKAFK